MRDKFCLDRIFDRKNIAMCQSSKRFIDCYNGAGDKATVVAQTTFRPLNQVLQIDQGRRKRRKGCKDVAPVMLAPKQWKVLFRLPKGRLER